MVSPGVNTLKIVIYKNKESYIINTINNFGNSTKRHFDNLSDMISYINDVYQFKKIPELNISDEVNHELVNHGLILRTKEN